MPVGYTIVVVLIILFAFDALPDWDARLHVKKIWLLAALAALALSGFARGVNLGNLLWFNPIALALVLGFGAALICKQGVRGLLGPVFAIMLGTLLRVGFAELLDQWFYPSFWAMGLIEGIFAFGLGLTPIGAVSCALIGPPVSQIVYGVFAGAGGVSVAIGDAFSAQMVAVATAGALSLVLQWAQYRRRARRLQVPLR
ncbi:Uncharacterised protein [uncultured Clostridium sp.]|nr:Uncharacterised protein [uncultured Clostridium sp.]